MDLMGFLSRTFFVPFYNHRHGISNDAVIDRLIKSQFFSEEQIRENQWRDLKSLLDFIYENNTFYRKRFDATGLTPADITSPEDFAGFPILAKDDIRNNTDDLITDGYEKSRMRWKRTGGSTGVPLQLYWDREAVNLKHAFTYRHNSWAGYRPGVKQAALWGDTDKKYSLKERIYETLYVRTIFLDTLNMNDERMHDFVRRIRRYKPRILFGHGHSLYSFAQFLLDNGLGNLRFEGVISTAETLFAHERAIVEKVFGNIVFDRYGCEEVSLIASECECHDGLHICAEGLYTELIGGDDVSPGRLIITDLANRGMPFIRYEIGDLATAKSGTCACGRGLPRIGKVVGRTTDMLYTPDGRKISGVSILDTFTIHIPGFKQTQIVQEKLDKIVFNVVKSEEFSDESLEILGRSVPKFFGPEMRYEVNFVAQIPLTGRGKFQFSVCKLDKTEL
ncbi:MAG: phenylacetate--CoA ligase family protein [Candidatus Zixiibacteriota bacterium]|nr:MAG: phenylacetate--CoA ligase family protein [candidate division Zixibacteria bacterium]